jgi:hypothetical protein
VGADSGPPFRDHSLLLLGLTLVAAYLSWQVIPLARRMDALERSQLEIRDRLLAKMDRLDAQVIAAAPATGQPAAAASPRETQALRPQSAATGAAEAAATPPAPSRPRVDLYAAERYLSRRFLPDDAAIAMLMLEGVPPAEIARRLKHSVAFVKAKGIQIEKQLAATPDAPPEILATIREAADRARSER